MTGSPPHGRHAPAVVSVVVPTFRGARHVAETLRAVLAQTQPGVELIVVDDGSDDDTCAQVQAAAPGAQLHRRVNGGVCAARNHGLSVARGTYVTFLDQDDIWHPKHLERQVAWLEAHPEVGAAVCPYHHWYPADTGYPPAEDIWPPDPGLTVDPEHSGWVYHQFLRDCWALTSATLMRRDLVVAAGGFDEARAYGEDWELWFRLSRQAPFARLEWPPVLYRQHPVQGSRTVRRVDFRTDLLLEQVGRFGLQSRDGRGLSATEFSRIVARYQREFGYFHLQHGHRWTGVQALWRAWRHEPSQLKALALAAAGTLGWRPQPDHVVHTMAGGPG